MKIFFNVKLKVIHNNKKEDVIGDSKRTPIIHIDGRLTRWQTSPQRYLSLLIMLKKKKKKKTLSCQWNTPPFTYLVFSDRQIFETRILICSHSFNWTVNKIVPIVLIIGVFYSLFVVRMKFLVVWPSSKVLVSFRYWNDHYIVYTNLFMWTVVWSSFTSHF